MRAAVAACLLARAGAHVGYGHPFQKRTNLSVWWLHFPKTGTSLSRTVDEYPVCCGRFVENHQPLAKGRDGDQLSSVVALFRPPAQRLLSMHYWLVKKAGRCCSTDWGWPPNQEAATKRLVAAGAPPAETVAAFGGCATAMILGRKCMVRDRAFAAADVDEAIARVAQFKVVGLTEEWRLSVCLLNAVQTGARFVTPSQMADVNPTNGDNATIYDAAELGAAYADADARLYAFAERRFRRDLDRFGVRPDSCADVSDDEGARILDAFALRRDPAGMGLHRLAAVDRALRRPSRRDPPDAAAVARLAARQEALEAALGCAPLPPPRERGHRRRLRGDARVCAAAARTS